MVNHMGNRKKVAILGSTGSIGLSSLDLVRQHPDRFEILTLVAGSNMELLVQQIHEFRPRYVSVKSDQEREDLIRRLGNFELPIGVGESGIVEAAAHPEVETVISALVGARGLIPTLAAIESGKTIALANKESMVIAGAIMNSACERSGAKIIPVDSEHSALFQCLQGGKKSEVVKLILTASGGPFLTRPLDTFGAITIAEALKHPKWEMGAKITIDSATMMNKGLEVMEAHFLFDMPAERIQVCVHPQSLVHSMVAFQDGSILAHLGLPDMRVPIAYALSFPDRITTGVPLLNLFEHHELTFLSPDFERFPCLRLAFEVAAQGRSYPAVLNAANEVAVALFLEGRIGFTDISALVETTLEAHRPTDVLALEDVLVADRWAREYAQATHLKRKKSL